MRLRRAVVVALVLLAAAVAPTDAAPRQSCNLVKDDSGDARFLFTGSSDPRDFKATDIVSADIASNSTDITATIRVRDLSVWRTESVGIEYAFGFTIGGTRFGLEARRTTPREASNHFGDAYTLWQMSGGNAGTETWRYAGGALGLFDEDTSQVHIYAKLAQLRLTARSRSSVTQLRVAAKQVEDGLIGSRSHTVDNASSDASYRLGDRSCAPTFRS